MTTILELNELDAILTELSTTLKEQIEVIDTQLITEIETVNQSFGYVRDKLLLTEGSGTIGGVLNELPTEDLLLFLSGFKMANIIKELVAHELHQRDQDGSVQETFQRLQKEANERVQRAEATAA